MSLPPRLANLLAPNLGVTSASNDAWQAVLERWPLSRPHAGVAEAEADRGREPLLAQISSQRKPSGKDWTPPVIANGKLYLRDQELLFCYDVK